MTFLAHQGTFVRSTTTGLQSITGIPFLPIALIVYAAQHPTVGFGFEARLSLGFTDGTRQFACGTLTRNFFGFLSSRVSASAVFLFPNFPTGGPQAQGNFISYDDNGGGDFGFTLGWTTNGGLASIVHYIALAGDDLSAFVGNFQGVSAPGDQAITGVGLKPDALLVAHGEVSALDFTVQQLGLGIGAATASDQAMLRGFSGGGANNLRAQDEGFLVLNTQGHAAPNVYSSLVHKSMDPDGFTVTRDITNLVPSINGYLALSGVSAAVGAETQPTSVSEKSITGLPFKPDALLAFGFNSIAKAIPAHPGNPYVDDCHWFMGASDGATEGGMGHHTEINSAAAVDLTYIDKIIEMADGNPPTATLSEADMKSFEAGGATLDWTKADAVAREFLYLALGPLYRPWVRDGEISIRPKDDIIISLS